MRDRLFSKGMCLGSCGLFNFGEATDNKLILETVLKTRTKAFYKPLKHQAEEEETTAAEYNGLPYWAGINWG